MDEEQSEEQNINSRPWLYKKGQSGNPGGRPKGSVSMKTFFKNKFLAMTDEEKEEFCDGLDKKFMLEMAEGKPDTKNTVEATVEVKPITGMKILKDG